MEVAGVDMELSEILQAASYKVFGQEAQVPAASKLLYSTLDVLGTSGQNGNVRRHRLEFETYSVTMRSIIRLSKCGGPYTDGC